jgi:hypothetical protein
LHSYACLTQCCRCGALGNGFTRLKTLQKIPEEPHGNIQRAGSRNT